MVGNIPRKITLLWCAAGFNLLLASTSGKKKAGCQILRPVYLPSIGFATSSLLHLPFRNLAYKAKATLLGKVAGSAFSSTTINAVKGVKAKVWIASWFQHQVELHFFPLTRAIPSFSLCTRTAFSQPHPRAFPSCVVLRHLPNSAGSAPPKASKGASGTSPGACTHLPVPANSSGRLYVSGRHACWHAHHTKSWCDLPIKVQNNLRHPIRFENI